MTYDPRKHHRRSIRLKNHDYTRGRYFVTCCTHRNVGAVFNGLGKEIVTQEWLALPQRFPDLTLGPDEDGYPFVVMPDHFHGLLELGTSTTPTSHPTLGDVMCAFKSLVVRRFIDAVKAGSLPPFPGKIWQRDYYERWIRTDDECALETICRYIRRNPWRLPVDIPLSSYDTPYEWVQGIGNPQLLERSKIGFLCSRGADFRAEINPASRAEINPAPTVGHVGVGHVGVGHVGVGLVSTLLPRAEMNPAPTVVSGFHSPVERRVLDELLADPRWGIIVCLPREMRAWKVPTSWIPALEQNRMLLLSPFDTSSITQQTAFERNRLVLALAEEMVVPYVRPGGSLDKLLQETT